MNVKPAAIRAYARLMNEEGLCSLEINEGDFHIKLEKAGAASVLAAPSTPTTAQAAPVPVSTPVQDDPGIDFNNARTVVSPMVGVFYAAASPDSAPFVTVGSRVKAGDTLCVIEAMKLMNEISAETDGEIVDICAANGDIVEFGQTLFKII